MSTHIKANATLISIYSKVITIHIGKPSNKSVTVSYDYNGDEK